MLAARQQNGGKIIFDDFRESYYWLRQNTKSDAKIMSWWDYGYQITAMANRTVLVDNNTWNNTHIATVGRAMASTEDVAYETMKRLDVSTFFSFSFSILFPSFAHTRQFATCICDVSNMRMFSG